MSARQYRSQIDSKRKQRIDADSKAGSYRAKEAAKRAAAAKATAAAQRSKSAGTISSKLREAERCEREANAAATESARWQKKAAEYAKQEADLQAKLARAEQQEASRAEQQRKREQELSQRLAAAESTRIRQRLQATEARVHEVLRVLPQPKPEPLRILMLGASSDGGLRIGREQKRIRAAVNSAELRDCVELDAHPAATAEDLLDGLARFRPHVVHFSGHSGIDSLEFEKDRDDLHEEGQVVTATAFASAIAATDTPPILVLLNSCDSAAHIDALVERVVPFAIGMTDEIDDGDAIIYAARFYANVANGQSIQSAHLAARASLELAGLSGAELPRLANAPDVDPATAILVKGPR